MDDTSSLPLVSVIIPVHNAAQTLATCLASLQTSAYPAWECIVVDDGSSDGSGAIALAHDATLLVNDSPVHGPAAARNRGAEAARGEILFFLDADVAVKPDTFTRGVAPFQRDPQLAACFGSYDDQPAATNFFSQYKNLQHHYVHQTAHEAASTFWAGCGAIRRTVFQELGGFNTLYRRPSIEDIELGYRLRAQGYRIRLLKEMQVTHLKWWTMRSTFRSDVYDRAIPWSRLILQHNRLPDDLNLKMTQRLSALAVWLALGTAVLSFLLSDLRLLTVLCLLLLLWLNRGFYAFLCSKRGLSFAIQSASWHGLYFLYSSASFAFVMLHVTWQRFTTRSGRAAAAAVEPR